MLARNSRRQFLVSGATIAAVTSVNAEREPVLAYAGTYSSQAGAKASTCSR